MISLTKMQTTPLLFHSPKQERRCLGQSVSTVELTTQQAILFVICLQKTLQREPTLQTRSRDSLCSCLSENQLNKNFYVFQHFTLSFGLLFLHLVSLTIFCITPSLWTSSFTTSTDLVWGSSSLLLAQQLPTYNILPFVHISKPSQPQFSVTIKLQWRPEICTTITALRNQPLPLMHAFL